jgi:hypothetical protein
LILIYSAAGASGQVLVLNLNYHDGEISLLNYTIKYGYYPDRNILIEDGYRLEIVSSEGVLYESSFKKPNEIFVDGTDEDGEISGGKIELSDVDFALTFPYYTDMEKIIVYDDKGVLLEEATIDYHESGNYESKWLYFGVGSVIILLLLFYLIFRKRSER